jgi:hypothetical protein
MWKEKEDTQTKAEKNVAKMQKIMFHQLRSGKRHSFVRWAARPTKTFEDTKIETPP